MVSVVSCTRQCNKIRNVSRKSWSNFGSFCVSLFVHSNEEGLRCFMPFQSAYKYNMSSGAHLGEKEEKEGICTAEWRRA